MSDVQSIHHGGFDYPLFPGLNSAFSYLSLRNNSFELEDVYWLTDFWYSDGNLYWLCQIFFSFIYDGKRVSDSVVVCVPDSEDNEHV